ncbi:uncharacterized protein LOC109790269 [Cajanus cajan]|uniref:uncharacterized protein LOC109790268 n=1 Tax=Cajanus cajan TaxID=3821 RepID=UPI00098DCD5A|nr:uncharacterized protein LOC109790268 [Cajanus cajan]XP_020204977.1 uncharacterized protein LOC109790269 [Cajanus cajan]
MTMPFSLSLATLARVLSTFSEALNVVFSLYSHPQPSSSPSTRNDDALQSLTRNPRVLSTFSEALNVIFSLYYPQSSFSQHSLSIREGTVRSSITREKFEELCKDIWEKLLSLVKEVLEHSSFIGIDMHWS